MGNFLKKIFFGGQDEDTSVPHNEKHEATKVGIDVSRGERVEQASEEVSRRFGKALERLTDR